MGSSRGLLINRNSWHRLIISRWTRGGEGTELRYSGMTGRWRRDIRNRKSAFCNHHSKDSVKQKSSMDVKSRENFWWRMRYLCGLKMSHHWPLAREKKRVSCRNIKQPFNQMTHINITNGALWPLRVPRYDTLKRTQHPICRISAWIAWPRPNHKETLEKPQMRNILSQEWGCGATTFFKMLVS